MAGKCQVAKNKKAVDGEPQIVRADVIAYLFGVNVDMV